MIIPLAALAGLLLPALLGGRLGRLGSVPLHGTGVVFGAFAVQFLAVSVLPGPLLLLRLLHVVSYLGAGWFVWANRRLPGLRLLAAGALSNGVTIAVNGGTLPASARALEIAGRTDGEHFANSAVLDHPRLALLGDVFAIPAAVPLANVFSVGDILIVAGTTWASLRICGSRWSVPWTPPAPRIPGYRLEMARAAAGRDTGPVPPGGTPGDVSAQAARRRGG